MLVLSHIILFPPQMRVGSQSHTPIFSAYESAYHHHHKRGVMEKLWQWYFAIVIVISCPCDGNSSLLHLCNNPMYTFPEGGEIDKNIDTALLQLQKSPFQAGGDYKQSEAGQGNSTVYAMVQCRGDTTALQCSNCTADASKSIKVCGNLRGAIVWLDYCCLRWENNDFFGILDLWDAPRNYYPPKAWDPEAFNTSVMTLMRNLSQTTTIDTNTNRYAFGKTVVRSSKYNNSTNMYGYVQCWKDVTVDDCKACLDVALRNLSKYYANEVGGRVYYGSCMARYETYRFFAKSADSSIISVSSKPATSERESTSSNGKLRIILGIIGGVAILSAFIITLFIFFSPRRRRRRRSENTGLLNELKERQLMFSLKSLTIATNNFHDDNKLGEGGFGSVYKGTLPNGREIGVKKLYVSSRQGQEEFLNEIKLLAQIQHRNLVNLLGCCIEDSQRILVYEYVVNKSLDHVLFDKERKKVLDWEKRYNIIFGIARGLQYLHEDSKLKIIHQDIKASNILLDDKFNSKIADFGLAKLFLDDCNNIKTTRIAGTYGYMAPEYVMLGELSVKADVYSFGVLLLEIISGKKNIEIISGKKNIEYRTSIGSNNFFENAWSSYVEENEEDMVDETIKDCSTPEQVLRCIHIALLCTQLDPSKRPAISEVILMLSTNMSLPSPAKPAFTDFEYRNAPLTTSSRARLSLSSVQGV